MSDPDYNNNNPFIREVDLIGGPSLDWHNEQDALSEFFEINSTGEESEGLDFWEIQDAIEESKERNSNHD